MAVKVFISFDFDHDSELRDLLVGQARNENSPFEIIDSSVKEELSGDWQKKVRDRIKKVEQVIVICGEYTNSAKGVDIELRITREEGKPYFLLWGRSGKLCKKPYSAKLNDKIYNWTWDNLKSLLNGGG